MAQHPLRLPVPPAGLLERLDAGAAVAWREPLVIPTYEPGEPDRYPMFLDRRVYQGSSGRVYPIPFIDRINTEPVDRAWDAIHLENRWIRLVVLPELGGRIHIGYDKSADYDFFYRNEVIKPALVGLAGPWISGGVEFNWPQHHRPATFLPVDVEIEEHADESVTVWCSDHDPFTRMKGMHGVRLYPDRAIVELHVRLHNRGALPQTFLWWANVAARVHDEYQSFFPTDVRYVADHARRAITAFPAADRPYYGVDYPARATDGGDRIDFYRNIPVPTSYMVTDTRDDFFGGYDHRAGAGFVHVADRHVAPGKKQWTWGDAPFGHAWDRLLTDGDEPYVELMAGVYTDNQPDFAWLEPGETKRFRQVWYPIAGIGPAHQANEDAAVRLDVDGESIRVGVAVTTDRAGAEVALRAGERLLWSDTVDLSPSKPLVVDLRLPHAGRADELELEVRHAGRVLMRWRPRPESDPGEPWTASEPPAPADIASVDELYFTGIHLAQYRHPTRSPLPYWEEALRRDAGDARCNVALADRRLRAGDYPAAEAHLRRAITRLTVRNGNPRDGEAYYLLGLVLARTGRSEAAVDALAKAAWDGRLVSPALGEAARVEARMGDDENARRHLDAALSADPNDSRSRALSIVLARRAGESASAERELRLWRAADPLDQLARALDGAPLSSDARTRIDVALDLSAMGESVSALALLAEVADADAGGFSDERPMARFHSALLLERMGRPADAVSERRRAREMPADRCFPHGLDDHDALCAALDADGTDHRAAALLGMLLFDVGRSAEALALWRRSLTAAPHPVTLRNAAIAAVNLEGDLEQARRWYQSALELAPRDGRLVFEFEQLLRRIGAETSERLAFLEERRDVVLERDDATVALCELLIAEGRAGEARELMLVRSFAPWEGGEGQTLAAWDHASLALAGDAGEAGEPRAALAFLDGALVPPRNLGEARHPLAPTAHIQLPRAELLDRLGRYDQAVEARADAEAHPLVPPASEPGALPDYFATSLPELLLFAPAAT